MPKIDIICLANSKKLQGRCIAGLRTDGQGWVRPVAAGMNGALHPGQYMLQNLTQPLLLDVISVSCSHQQIEPHQPENWLLDGARWQLVSRPAPAEYAPVLRAGLVSGPDIFGNSGDRVSYAALAAAPVASSLALVIPENLRWNITTNYRGNRQTKASFTLLGSAYNLSITDPVWPSRLDHLPVGLYPVSAANIAPNEYVMFTISLGEPTSWDNCCYKLVAGVIVAQR